MPKPLRTIKFSSNLRYREDCNEYKVRMVNRRFPWWILLCLLPLLLLIECDHTFKVHVYEEGTDIALESVEVEMSYISHFLYKDRHFFRSKSVEKTEFTNEDGVAIFKDCPCSVFSYIFYCMSQVTFKCSTECHSLVDVTTNFHYSWNINMPLKVLRENLKLRVKDKESGDLLPDALVTYQYRENGKEYLDSTRTDAGGIAVLKNMRLCAQIDRVTASLYGYADTLRCELPCKMLTVPTDSTDLRLRRIKEQIEFFVKDSETGEPIPDADCLVSMSYKNETTGKRVKTSIDGKGRGIYDNAFLLYTIRINASKQNYNDSILEGGPYLVDKFNELDSLKRTIWLRPVPYKVDFVNVDSITGQPIPNVRNTIIIRDKDSQERSYIEISNRNGIFPVVAKGNKSVIIISERSPEYWNKKMEIDILSEADNKVPMTPRNREISFKTVKQTDTYPLLPDCKLKIIGSISGNLDPTDSGDGNFTVQALINEHLTITASKSNYDPNTHTVNNTPVANLLNKITLIPLKENPLIYNYDKIIQGVTKECYNLLEAGSTVMFTWSVCAQCTMLIVTDENGNELKRLGRNDPNGNGGGIQYSPSTGSITLKIPTQNVCITQVNVNGHRTCYSITKL